MINPYRLKLSKKLSDMRIRKIVQIISTNRKICRISLDYPIFYVFIESICKKATGKKMKIGVQTHSSV